MFLTYTLSFLPYTLSLLSYILPSSLTTIISFSTSLILLPYTLFFPFCTISFFPTPFLSDYLFILVWYRMFPCYRLFSSPLTISSNPYFFPSFHPSCRRRHWKLVVGTGGRYDGWVPPEDVGGVMGIGGFSWNTPFHRRPQAQAQQSDTSKEVMLFNLRGEV